MTPINKITGPVANVTDGIRKSELFTPDGLKKVCKTIYPDGKIEIDTFCTSTGEKLFHSTKTPKQNGSKLIKAYNYIKKTGITIAQLTLGGNKAKMQTTFKHNQMQKIIPNGKFIHIVNNKLEKEGNVKFMPGRIAPDTPDLIIRTDIFNKLFGKIQE
ncbi:MAG: hypothetical protein IKU37_03055 [Candidatus Gastranaerophilales bacterium]|nr:hypothetical protein [Candidatus Gastranaerophilales bacterium]